MVFCSCQEPGGSQRARKGRKMRLLGAYWPATGAKSGEYVPDEGTWGGDGNIFIEYRACRGGPGRRGFSGQIHKRA